MSGTEGPSLLQVIYDAVGEIKGAVGEVVKGQQDLALKVERQMTEAGQMKADLTDLETRMTALESKAANLARIAWVLGIIGSFVVVVATGVATEAVNRMMTSEKPHYAAPTITNSQPKD